MSGIRYIGTFQTLINNTWKPFVSSVQNIHISTLTDIVRKN